MTKQQRFDLLSVALLRDRLAESPDGRRVLRLISEGGPAVEMVAAAVLAAERSLRRSN